MLDFQIQKIVPIFRVNALVNAAYYNLPENYQFSGESHDFCELSYVDRGQVVIRHDDSSYLLKSGEMLFCKPDVFHSVRVLQGKPAAIVNIAFAVEGDLEVFEDKILVLSAEERQCMAAIVREAAQTYVHFDNLPAQIRLHKGGGFAIIETEIQGGNAYGIFASRNYLHIFYQPRPARRTIRLRLACHPRGDGSTRILYGYRVYDYFGRHHRIQSVFG